MAKEEMEGRGQQTGPFEKPTIIETIPKIYTYMKRISNEEKRP